MSAKRHATAPARARQALILASLATLTLLPLRSHGTGDVDVWLSWIDTIERDGVVAGYIPIYPPLAWMLLKGVSLAHHVLAIETFLALKWSLVAGLCATSLIFAMWTRSPRLAALLHLSLLLSSVVLGYLDIWFAPPLLLALWALQTQRLALFSVFYTASCLVKWQPLIIGPFLLAHILCPIGFGRWRRLLQVLCRDVILPGGLLLAATAVVFREGLLRSLEDALGHEALSANALNYNWVLTYYYRVIHPERFGPLIRGMVDFIDATPWTTALLSKSLFVACYVVALAVFCRGSRSFASLIRLAMVGYLAYFTFNIGVHENHLFLPAVLAVILIWVSARDRWAAIYTVVIANVNLLVFYGFDGRPTDNRVIAGIDGTVPLALLNVACFLAFWMTTCWREWGPPRSSRTPGLPTVQP